MRKDPKPYEIYEHSNGKKYQVIAVAEHVETKEKMIVYQALYDIYKIYTAPYSFFFSKVREENHLKQKEKPEIVAAEEEQTEGKIDSMVLEFLEAESYEERLNILASLRHRITDDMINTMAIAVGVEVPEGLIEKRYDELRYCITTLQKYESGRRE